MRVYSSLLSVAVLGFAASSVSANVINVNVTAPAQFGGAQYLGTGPILSGTNYWNWLQTSNGNSIATTTNLNFPAPPVNPASLSYADGTPTSGVGFTVTGTNPQGGTTSNGLLDGEMYTLSTGNFTITGLNPSAYYDVYLFGANFGSNFGQIVDWTTFGVVGVVGTQSTDANLGLPGPSTYTSTSIPTDELGHAYVEFAGVNPNVLNQISGTFTAGPNNGAGASPIGVFSGFQLVEHIVPEPASLGMLGVGALALIRRAAQRFRLT